MNDPRDTSFPDTTLVTDVALEDDIDDALSICIDEGRCEPLADLLRYNRHSKGLARDITEHQLCHRFCKLSAADVALIVARMTPPILAVPTSQRNVLFQLLHRTASRVLAPQPAEDEHGSTFQTRGSVAGDERASSPGAAAGALSAPAYGLHSAGVRAVLECARHQEFKRAKQARIGPASAILLQRTAVLNPSPVPVPDGQALIGAGGGL
ncbi:hypothetical protein H632_c4087p0 [Helicosporidium sp. ATCC 50920]|nr:hypothetical protein H632_c4087p0 [Helicosporidium sp. ATCC 50920]|eukprot:KDD71964.1 hypothetical protein H632_c4087p0 [Helicosporidium sp. ATCC 50920]